MRSRTDAGLLQAKILVWHGRPVQRSTFINYRGHSQAIDRRAAGLTLAKLACALLNHLTAYADALRCTGLIVEETTAAAEFRLVNEGRIAVTADNRGTPQRP